jgi:HK97 family phage major capsid protein
MPFNNIVSRADAASLIPAEQSKEIIKGVEASNPLLSLARRLPNMSSNVRTMPVLSALAMAYFVNGDTGLKQTTEVNWGNVNITAEEIAAIVPMPIAVLDDMQSNGYDAWGQIRPELVDAINVAIINAVLFGVNIPASWTVSLGAAGLSARCVAAGHNPSVAAFPDLYDAILAESAQGLADGAFMLVENDGFGVSGCLAHPTLKGRLRGLRDVNGNPVFKRDVQSPSQYELDGAPLAFATDGTFNPANALMFAGDWQQLVYSIRQDISWSIADQAIIQDAAGNSIYNLFQQDMVALRVVIRLGFALPNPINRMNQVAATRLPFAMLIP